MSTQDQELQYSFSVLADSLVDRVIAGVYSHVRAGNILQVQKGSQHWVRHISAQASLLYSPSSDRASKIIVSPSSGSTTNKAFAQSFNSPRERLRGSGRRSDAEAAKNYARITRLLRQKEQEMLSAKRAQRMSDERTYPYAARSRRVRPLKKPGQSVLVKELLGRLNDEARNTKLETSDVVGLLAVQQEQARLREHRRARRLRKREMVRQRELTRKRVMKELRVRESERSGLSLRIEMTRHEQEDHARNRKEQLRKEREKEKQLQRVCFAVCVCVCVFACVCACVCVKRRSQFVLRCCTCFCCVSLSLSSVQTGRPQIRSSSFKQTQSAPLQTYGS